MGVRFELKTIKCYSFVLLMSIKSFDPISTVSTSKRACVIFPGALGDFVCFLPALHALRRDWEIDFFARSEFADIVPSGVSVRSLECAEISRLFIDDAAPVSAQAKFFGDYAAVYSWLGSQQPVFVRRLQADSAERAKLFPFRPSALIEHQADYYLRCLDLPSSHDSVPSIELRAEAIEWCDNFRRQHLLDHRAVLALAPGSGAREKNWPEHSFLAVAEWWREATGGAVVLLVGPVESERGGIDRLRQQCLVAADLSLAQLAALISCSDAYLGNDSGVTHLAAAIGVPTFALFGPSDGRQWAPRGKQVVVISREIACSPCTDALMKSCPHHACLTELTADRAIGAMKLTIAPTTLTRVGAGITV
ncbi:MAG: glycosyltransferase family 9 protein [Deltaproteobacteria bacterium]|nr:glycosyltransferase family 9 protein [Deltaproteobacteria bacterium]